MQEEKTTAKFFHLSHLFETWLDEFFCWDSLCLGEVASLEGGGSDSAVRLHGTVDRAALRGAVGLVEVGPLRGAGWGFGVEHSGEVDLQVEDGRCELVILSLHHY